MLVRSDNNPGLSHRLPGWKRHCGSLLVDLPNFLNGIINTGSFHCSTWRPSSSNLTCCPPAPLIVSDVLAFREPLPADRDLACKKGHSEPT